MYALVLAGCGRVAFDPVASRDATVTADDGPPDADDCRFSDDFNNGIGSWQRLMNDAFLAPGIGPDGSTAFGAMGATAGVGEMLSHPTLVGFSAIHVSVDFEIVATTGDFNVMLFQPGWTSGMEQNYEVGVFALAGDTSPDWIVRFFPPNDTLILDQHAISVPVDTWHHLDVRRFVDGRITAELDGAPYMSSAANTEIAPPFDLAIRLYNEAYLDNIVVTCLP